MCVCVCVFLYLLHIEYQKTGTRTFLGGEDNLSGPPNFKGCLKVKTWLKLELGLVQGLDGVVRVRVIGCLYFLTVPIHVPVRQ